MNEPTKTKDEELLIPNITVKLIKATVTTTEFKQDKNLNYKFDNTGLYTFQLHYPRFILAEVNTHRTFCLEGSMELEFDLLIDDHKKVAKTTIENFVKTWLYGTNSQEKKLKNMRIRVLNEETNMIETATVKNCCISGNKRIYEIKAGEFKLRGSIDHLIKTKDGYIRIGDITPGQTKVLCKKTDLTTDDLSSHEEIVEYVLDTGETKETYDIEIEGKYPNFIANGIVVHNSRNTSSSRAIPNKNIITTLQSDPAFFVYVGKNQSGMVANDEVSDEVKLKFQKEWLDLMTIACEYSQRWANDYQIHKQTANRVLEPFIMTNTVITTDKLDNFFKLRCHKDAQPEFRALALKMRDILNEVANKTNLIYFKLNSQINNNNFINGINSNKLDTDFINNFYNKEYKEAGLKNVQYILKHNSKSSELKTLPHIPYVTDEELKTLSLSICFKISAARVARISYNNHDGTSPSVTADINVYNKLVESDPNHGSPVEHQAYVFNKDIETTMVLSGNFYNNKFQLRQLVEKTSLNNYNIDNIQTLLKDKITLSGVNTDN